MEIVIVVDSKDVDNNFKLLAEQISGKLIKEHIAEKVYIYEELQSNLNMQETNLYLVISNDIRFVKDLKGVVDKCKIVIHITNNLSANHIIDSLKYVSDICYANLGMDSLVSRIVTSYNRQNTREGLNKKSEKYKG